MPGGPQKHDFGAGNTCKNRQGTTGVTEATIFAILGGPSVAQGGGNGAQINVKLMRKLTWKSNVENRGFPSTAETRKSMKIICEIDRKTERGATLPKV